MNKYCVIIGENNDDLSKEVCRELKKAGFKAHGSEAFSVKLICINEFTYGEYGEIRIDVENRIKGMQIIFPSDILNGGAMTLDGAKKVEPRWFLQPCTRKGFDVIHCRSGEKSKWMNFDGDNFIGTNSDSPNYFANHPDFTEITEEAVAYITDNAEKAKELGLTLKKFEKGDEAILLDGTHTKHANFNMHDNARVAGYRYCKKAELKTLNYKIKIDNVGAFDKLQKKVDEIRDCKKADAETVATAEVVIRYESILGFANKEEAFCHNCSEPVTPSDSNYCRHCRAKLEK